MSQYRAKIPFRGEPGVWLALSFAAVLLSLLGCFVSDYAHPKLLEITRGEGESSLDAQFGSPWMAVGVGAINGLAFIGIQAWLFGRERQFFAEFLAVRTAVRLRPAMLVRATLLQAPILVAIPLSALWAYLLGVSWLCAVAGTLIPSFVLCGAQRRIHADAVRLIASDA